MTMHDERHANEEARVHETLSLQAERWKIHCDELNHQFEAERLELTEEISLKERDIDELSAKFIEASEQLEQWEYWWKERSTDKSEAKPIDHHLEGLKPIIEEELQQQPTTPFVLSKPSIPQEFLPPPLPPKFAHISFPRRANESEGSGHTGTDPQAMPTFAPTTPPSSVQTLQ